MVGAVLQLTVSTSASATACNELSAHTALLALRGAYGEDSALRPPPILRNISLLVPSRVLTLILSLRVSP